MVDDERAQQGVNSDVVDRVSNFLVVATNIILYMHQVYPHRMFGMRNYDGLCVFMCRHPEVVEYITTTMTTIHEWMTKRQVEGVTIVVFTTGRRKLIAKYVYDIEVLVDDDVATAPAINEFDLATLDSQLRAHVTRLMAVGSPSSAIDMSELSRVHSADPLPHSDDGQEKSFDILVHTTGTNHRQYVDWVPANDREVWAAANPIATPIKDADRNCVTAAICARVETDDTSGANQLPL